MILKESKGFLSGGVGSPVKTELPGYQQVIHQTYLTMVSHCNKETNLARNNPNHPYSGVASQERLVLQHRSLDCSPVNLCSNEM